MDLTDFIFATLFMVVGWVMLYAARYLKRQFKKRYSGWIKTTATVTGISVQNYGDSGNTYYPRYHYSCSGCEYTGTSSVGRKRGTYSIGDKIEILVDPSRPEKSDVVQYIRISQFVLLLSDFIIISFSATGFIFILIGLITAVLSFTGLSV